MKHAICSLTVACVICAQTPILQFEVASVKPARPASDEHLSVEMSIDPARISYVNVTLKNIISQAYRVKEYQVSGPDWLETERFDIVAKIPAGVSTDKISVMLQALLSERFKVGLHKQNRVMSAYGLVIAKSGSKLSVVHEEPGDLRMMIGSKGRHISGNATMTMFSSALSNWTDRPVVDMTGRRDVYDIDIEWSGGEGPADLRMVRPGPDREPRSEEGGNLPLLSGALEKKLGLRLQRRKLPVEILVIDHAERVPSEN